MDKLQRKFQIKPEMAGGVYGRPEDVVLPFPEKKKLLKANGDYVIVFVSNAAEIKLLAEKAVRTLREDGLLWFCYSKKSSGVVTDIHRDVGWGLVTDMGFRGIRSISIDSTWSGIRFRDQRFVG